MSHWWRARFGKRNDRSPGDGAEALREAARERGIPHVSVTPDGASALSAELLAGRGRELAEAGELPQAMELLATAVERYRELSGASPSEYGPRLAAALHRLALTESDLGQVERSLTHSTEAVGLARALLPDDPAFAALLVGHAVVRVFKGVELPQALDSIEEATRLYERFAYEDPVEYGQQLVGARRIMATALHAVGEHDAAEELSRNADRLEPPAR